MIKKLHINSIFTIDILDLSTSYNHGNKHFKLKYNLEQAKKEHKNTLLTFGGAFSNHIAATAQIGNENGFKTIGIIRGEELHSKSNTTLIKASSYGMQLKFVSRDVYRTKNEDAFVKKLKQEFGEFYLLPEGGTNALAVKGCEEILTNNTKQYNYICCPVGTGGTISGIINASKKHQKIIGFPALKGDFLIDEIKTHTNKHNWHLETKYHFGGYSKIRETLIHFINTFSVKYNIQLEPIYTGKMLFGILDLIKKGTFAKESKILVIHTGGLQGLEGVNLRLEAKNSPIIKV